MIGSTAAEYNDTNMNTNIENVNKRIKDETAYDTSFFLSKFNVDENNSTITNMKCSIKLKDLTKFDNGALHSFDVFKKKASTIVSNDKLDVLKQIKNGNIEEKNGLAYSIYSISSPQPKITGYSTSFQSLVDAIGQENVNNIQNGQFRIVWTGFFISKNTSSKPTLYNFSGTNTNSSSTSPSVFKVKIDDGLRNSVNSINNNTFQQYFYENTLYPIQIVYNSQQYSKGDDLSLKMYAITDNGMVDVLKDKLFYLNNKTNGTLYKQPNYYFGIIKIQQLYRFYFINNSEYRMYSLSLDPITTTTESLSYKDNEGNPILATTADVNDDTQVNIYRLNTDYKVNKTFYVNEKDNQMTFVPYNTSSVLKHNIDTPYILSGNFAPLNGITNASTVENYNGCKMSCDNNPNCTSFYYLENREYITKIEKKEQPKVIDVSYIAQEKTIGPVPKEYKATSFVKQGNSYVPTQNPFTRTEQGELSKEVILMRKDTIPDMVDTPVQYPITVNKCVINTDDNESTNIVPLNKMNSIQPDSSIISSQLYIKNKDLGMDSTYMQTPIPSKNSYIGYNLNDNYTHGYVYVGEMNNPVLVGKPSAPPVPSTTNMHNQTLNTLIKGESFVGSNQLQPFSGFVESFQSINAVSNSTLSQLYTINSLNRDISGNLKEIDTMYNTLKGNCDAAQTDNDYQNCIKYKFSTGHEISDITKKIKDKNDAYQEDLTEVQLQQNNMYVLGAITTASLLVFAIMLGRE
jgi:hypothetical protein